MEIIILIFKRLLSALPSLFGVLLITFILTHALPGDPAAYLAGPAATDGGHCRDPEGVGFG